MWKNIFRILAYIKLYNTNMYALFDSEKSKLVDM